MRSGPILTHDNILVNPPQADVDSNISVAKFILELIKQNGNETALVHSLTEDEMSFNDIVQQSIAVSQALKGKGIRPGDVISICSENRLEYAPVILGILATGATCAPINPIYTVDELLHVFSISQPIMVFCSPFTIDKVNETCPKMPFIKELILFGDYDSESTFASYNSLLKVPVCLNSFEVSQGNPREDVAFLLCSSGTTGLPKCVELTHMNFMCFLNFVRILMSGRKQSLGKKVTLGLIPFFHGYGCSILLISLISRFLCIVMPRFDEENFLHSIERYKITNLFLVPPLVVFLSKHPLVSKYDLSSIEEVTCGAAPLSKETQVAAQKRLKLKKNFRQGYGMTELTVACVGFQTEDDKIGSCGTIAPGVELKIVDADTGKTLPPLGKGELCFRGPFVMKGYKNNPEATKECFDSEGWFHTGDVGYFDNEGFVFIVSRLKELIKYKGFQVAPAELETILINHPGVKDAGVIGIPDEEAGELPLAFVVKQPGAKITEEELKKYVAGKVSPQKRLHGGVRFIEEIPKNLSGKILRKELHALLYKSKL